MDVHKGLVSDSTKAKYMAKKLGDKAMEGECQPALSTLDW